VNHRRGADDENAECEVPMEYRSGSVQHTVENWQQEVGV